MIPFDKRKPDIKLVNTPETNTLNDTMSIVQRNTNKHTSLFFIAIYAHRLTLRYILKGHIHIAVAKYQAWEGLVS